MTVWASISQGFVYDRWGNRTIDQTPVGSNDGTVWIEDAVPAGALVDVGAHRPGHVGQLEEELAADVGGAAHVLIISKLMIFHYAATWRG